MFFNYYKIVLFLKLFLLLYKKHVYFINEFYECLYFFVKNTGKVFGSFPCNKCWYSIIFLPNKVFYVNMDKCVLFIINRSFF